MLVIGGFKFGFWDIQISYVGQVEARLAHHNICDVETSLSDMWGDKLRYSPLAQMDVEVCRRVDRDTRHCPGYAIDGNDKVGK